MLRKFKLPPPSRRLLTAVNPSLTTSDHINALCIASDFSAASSAFLALPATIPLDAPTLRHLIHAAVHLRSPSLLLRLLPRLPNSIPLHNHALSALGKLSLLPHARHLFDSMLQRNVTSWSNIIASYASNSEESQALELFLSMQEDGVYPDRFGIAAAVGACSRVGCAGSVGVQLHVQAVKFDCWKERIVGNALVAMYGKAGFVGDARDVFQRMRERDLVSWGAMCSGLARSKGFEIEALQCFREMVVAEGLVPNEVVFETAFRACGEVGNVGYAEMVHCFGLKFGVGRSAFSGSSVVDMYARVGCLEGLMKAFGWIGRPDLVAWNSIIGGLAGGEDKVACLVMFLQMMSSDMEPDGMTVCHLLGAFKSSDSLSQGQMTHCYVIKMGFDVNVAVCNSLLTMYSKCSLDHSTVCRLFKEMVGNRDLVSFNIFLRACFRHGKLEEAFRLFTSICSSGMRPDHITLNIMLCVSAELASQETNAQIHSHSFKVGLESNLLVSNSLIDAYMKSGNLKEAMKLCKLVRGSLDVVSWTSLITGCAQFGYAKEAIGFFHEMQKLCIKPNYLTFVGVLLACSRAGFLHDGFHYFESMQTEHGITPTKEHFTCLIDMLARAGFLEEAERYIDGMPSQPDVAVWKSLLAGSRIHGNVEIAERAAEAIFKLDPSNYTAYTLLSDVYAAAGYWYEVRNLRKMMRNSGSEKRPGKSWLCLKEKVHAFVVADRKHPKAVQIYALLGVLLFEMSEDGYSPCPEPL